MLNSNVIDLIRVIVDKVFLKGNIGYIFENK